MTQESLKSISPHVLPRLKAVVLENKPAMAAVQQNGYAIRYLTEAQRTPEVCLAAVQQSPESVQFFHIEEVEHEGEAGDRLRDALLQSWDSIEPHLNDDQRQAFAQVLLAHAQETSETEMPVERQR